MQAVGVRGKRRHREVFLSGVGVKLVGERVEAHEPPVILTPNMFLGFENPQVMRDLAIAHLKSAHQRTEMTARVGREIPHQPTALVAAVRGFVGLAKKAKEPQARHRCGEAERFVGGSGDHEQREQ